MILPKNIIHGHAHVNKIIEIILHFICVNIIFYFFLHNTNLNTHPTQLLSYLFDSGLGLITS